jgi:hypothetical protein
MGPFAGPKAKTAGDLVLPVAAGINVPVFSLALGLCSMRRLPAKIQISIWH